MSGVSRARVLELERAAGGFWGGTPEEFAELERATAAALQGY